MHPYAAEPSRVVPAYHYCTHNISSDLHQCIIFDSNEPSARLIGVEYIITEKVFETLDDEEKRLWHSHKYEIESGILTMVAKQGIPGGVDDMLEIPALKDLHTTYGKTWHLWQIDQGHSLPLGLPSLMKSFNGPSDVTPQLIREHEERTGTNVKDKAEYRAKHLDTSYKVMEGADAKGPEFQLIFKVGVSPPTRTPAALSSAITYFTGSRNSNETITPFVAIPEQHTRSKGSPNRPAPQNTNGPGTNSSFCATPGELCRGKIANFELSESGINLARMSTGLPPLIQRQQLLEEEAGRLRLQIMSMVNSALPRSDQVPTAQNFQSENHQMAAEMERMRTQVETLEQDRDPSWARRLSDEPRAISPQ
ncbi:hypothetical protein HHX47_DHR6000691 [Lentinula edodes]|nr:hypothetical protein HHX47_DHR6000691 [Lentinula edodes]